MQITKGKTTFIETALGAWATLLLAVGGGLLNYQLTAPGTAFLGAAAIVLVYAAIVHYQHKVQQQRSIAIWPILLTLPAHTVCLTFGVLTWLDLKSIELERFHFTAGTVLQSNLDPSHATPLRALSGGPSPVALPIQFLLSATIENVQQNASTILAYSIDLSESADGPWKKLCPINLVGRTLVWAHESKEAAIINTDNFFDRVLLGKTIAPRSVLSGWSAWQCPGVCRSDFFKITIRDSAGNRSAAILKSPQPEREAALGAGLVFTGDQIDIARAPIQFERGCAP